MPISFDFQKRFLDLVDELNESNMTSIAKRMGVTYVIFSKITNYGILPKPKVLIRIADFFNISIEYLLAHTDNDYFDKSTFPKTFLERLEELRQSKGITYSKLGSDIHVHRNSLYEWKKNNFLPTLEILDLLADYFNVSIDYLLGRTDDDTPYK